MSTQMNWWRRVTMRQFARTVKFLAAACMLGLVACNKDLVTIHYNQPANAYIFDSDPIGIPHTTTSAGDGIFAFYCINAIENKDTNAHDFNFDVSKIYVNDNLHSIAGDVSFNFMVQTAPSTLKVPAYSTSSTLGRVVVNISGGLDPNNLGALDDLYYNSSAGESVLLERDDFNNPPPAQFLDPASPIHPDNLPACL
jgi:hypothetical protein